MQHDENKPLVSAVWHASLACHAVRLWALRPDEVSTDLTPFVCASDSSCTTYDIDDGYCDCPDCSDETSWTCATCGNGCPETCGEWTQCENLDVFDCASGSCSISANYVNDSSCDCPDCSDETDWTCATCGGGCPETCGDYTLCPIIETFNCSTGCSILMNSVNDSYCDCEDRPSTARLAARSP